MQAVAESLFGAVLHQLRVPGAPLLTGMGPVKLDMNTVQALYNSAEYYTTIMGMTVFYAAFLISMVFVVDLFYCLIDPRIKYE